MLRSRRDFPAECSAEPIEHPSAARKCREYAPWTELEIGVAGESGRDRHAAHGDVLYPDPAPGIGIDHSRVASHAFRKPIQRERRDLLHDLVLYGAGDAALGHALAQPALDAGHPLDRALEAHRAAELFGLAAGEA